MFRKSFFNAVLSTGAVLSFCLPFCAVQAAPVAASLAYSQRLQQLPEIQRFAVLRGALNDSGFFCRRVSAATPNKEGYDNLAMWSVRCQNDNSHSQDFAVFLGPDGSAQIRQCKDTKTLNLPVCNFPVVQEKAKDKSSKK
ncbi:MAG: hypothetical protein ABF760_02405 [Zymomonas mobilis]|uniref:Uncharacterized protein n=1 Tax=Zymomonas mobilis TaxID=542 RepID=A0A542VYZ2_ZYMMB|nr:hypothetical protein [Zymomonas mobilis]TQL16541.1 hypothetical protein FBY58_0077 [Zymomonas mobilis]